MATRSAAPTGRRATPAQMEARVVEVEKAIGRGLPVRQACRSAGIAVPTYYRWRGRDRTGPAKTPGAGDATRRRILEAARAQFLREGFGAGVEGVARAAGVTRKTVYDRFGSKERLFGEVVEALYNQLLPPALLVDPGGDLEAMLEASGRYLIEFLFNPEVVALMRIALGEYRERPELASLAYAMRSSPTVPNVAGAIARRLEKEMAAGRLDRADPRLAAESFIGAFVAHPRHRALIGNPPPTAEIERRLRFAIRLLLGGLNYRGPA